MIDHISHTQIEMMLRCPRQYYYRYVLGLKIPTSYMLALGSACHIAWEHNYRQKVLSGVDLALPTVLEVYADAFERKTAEEEIDWQDHDPGQVKDTGISLVTAHMAQIAPEVQPVSVEARFQLDNVGVPVALVGVIDLIDVDGYLHDHKTATRSWTQDQADSALQPAPYILAYRALTGQNPTGFRYNVTVSKKTPEVQVLTTNRSDDELLWYIDLVREVVKQIQAGLFPPNPTGWWCSERWCGYYDMCKRERNYPRP